MYFQRMKKAFLNLSLTSKLKYIYTALDRKSTRLNSSHL